MRKIGLAAISALAGVSFATTAGAASVTSLFDFNDETNLNDRSAETLIKGCDVAVAGCDTGIVQEDDLLRGVINIDTIEGTGIGTASGSAHNELIGIFEVRVDTKAQLTGTGTPADPSDDTFGFEFAPSSDFATEAGGYGFSNTTGAAVAFFEDSSPDFGPPDPRDDASTATAMGSATPDGDSTLFWLLGFDGLDDFWVTGVFPTDDLDVVATFTSAVGSFNAGLSLLDNPTGPDVNEFAAVAPSAFGLQSADVDIFGSGDILAPSSNSGWDAFNRTDFTLFPVPEPASLGLFGIGLLGLGAAAARRRKAA